MSESPYDNEGMVLVRRTPKNQVTNTPIIRRGPLEQVKITPGERKLFPLVSNLNEPVRTAIREILQFADTGRKSPPDKLNILPQNVREVVEEIISERLAKKHNTP